MANSSIPYRSSLAKMNLSKRSDMEALICQASGLVEIIVEKDLFAYEPANPTHKVLWLLCDLIIKIESLLAETTT